MPNLTTLLLPLSFLLLLTPTIAHMQLTYPPPLRSQLNPHTSPNNIDYSLTSPLSPSGSDYPCKGALSLLHTSQALSVATWTAGQTYNFTVSGGAAHGGGSCQAGLSIDGGRTFRVVHSYMGGCPAASGQGGSSSWRFRVPGDVGDTRGAVFAWGWYNRLGNREFYMNCAVADVVRGKGGGGHEGREKVPFGRRPEMFKANVGNGCVTVEGRDVRFPEPGLDVDVRGEGDLAPPRGNCGGGNGGSEQGDGSGVGTGSSDSAQGSSAGANESSEVASPTAAPNSCYPGSAEDGSSDDGTGGRGWIPGNDWPDWFLSAAPRVSVMFLHAFASLWVLCVVCHLLR